MGWWEGERGKGQKVRVDGRRKGIVKSTESFGWPFGKMRKIEEGLFFHRKKKNGDGGGLYLMIYKAGQ